MNRPASHTPSEHDPGRWHALDDHLKKVASCAEGFAGKFSAGSLGRWLGLLHDIGKFNPEFQEYLQAVHLGASRRRGPPHSVWGSALAFRLLSEMGESERSWAKVAAPIAGHHGSLKPIGTLKAELQQVAGKAFENYAHYLSLLEPPDYVPVNFGIALRDEFIIRMLLSALVDADRLDTESHTNPNQSQLREYRPTVAALWRRFKQEQDEFIAKLDPNEAKSGVNKVRQQVYEACLECADESQGVFRLTVPTGGGKTRSGLAFALKHSERHGLDRVIVAVPYTSIINQTVKTYRDILGAESVLEHHSRMEASDEEDERLDLVRLRLATENWDMPLVVTTTVQLFESLFSNRASRVRKLHNISNSVIILDEVQTLPPGLLRPTLDVLRTLVEDYGVTIVLSTATQPAFDATPHLQRELGTDIRRIIPREVEQDHFARLDRVRYDILPEPISWDQLAELVKQETQVMVILNRRRDALSLLDALGDDKEALHLSTLLCGRHRDEVLEKVQKRLDPNDPQPIRLISTQVVEAGVDLDFPAVYRAIGPLDRIVQAAGRCNREGMRPDKGRVIVFDPAEGGTPQGPYAIGLRKAELILRQSDPNDLHNPQLYEQYFQALFNELGEEGLDKKDIQRWRSEFDYPEVAERYRLIEQDTVSVVVPYGDWEARLQDWESRPCLATWQRLQPFVVNVYKSELKRLPLKEVSEELYKWDGPEEKGYDLTRGFIAVFDDPSDLIVHKPKSLVQG